MSTGGVNIPELSMDLDSIIMQSKRSGLLGGRRRGNRAGRGGASSVAGTNSAVTPASRQFDFSVLRSFASSNRTAGKRASAPSQDIVSDRRRAHVNTPRRSLGAVHNGAINGSGSGGAKIVVSNLDFGVSEDDLWEIFTRCGKVRKVQLNFDCYGQSTGTAVVLFERQGDALKAIEEFHNVPLDSRRMHLELSISPAKIQAQASSSLDSGLVEGRLGGRFSGEQGRSRQGFGGASNGGGSRNFQGKPRRGRSGRFNRGQRSAGPKSVSDLDTDLAAYMAQRGNPATGGAQGISDAMQTD